MISENNFYSLIPLDEFRAVLGVDERDDKIARFCLVTSTLTIEQYCKRKLCFKTNHQLFKEWDLTLFLNEYPVNEILSVSTLFADSETEIIEPEFYYLEPLEENENIPYQLNLSLAIKRMRDVTAIKVIYNSGYLCADVPSDLKAACLELASWNMSRYKGRRVGMSGNIKGAGVQGEHFEMSMPENVKLLLEPYKRRVI